MSKPRLSLADGLAYAKVASLPVGAALTFDGQRATFDGMAGYLITLKVQRRTIYLRAGDPLLLELRPE